MIGRASRVLALLDIGSTYTKGSLVEKESGVILERVQFPTTPNDIADGAGNVLAYLQERMPDNEFSWKLVPKLACSSAAGGLQMVAIGLVPDLTAKAAKEAVLGAGARVQKCYSYELTATDLAEIQSFNPDIILLAGGTDGGSREVLLHNAEALASLSLGIPLVLAGNRSAADEAKSRLIGHYTVHVCDNVMPAIDVLQVEPARQRIREIFLATIVGAKGLDRLNRYFGQVLMPTPAAVLEASSLLYRDLGDVIVVDLGGATTDVHSVCRGLPTNDGVVLRGLPEPLIKRTVEGDLGLRVSAAALLANWSLESWAESAGTTVRKAQDWLDSISDNPGVLAETVAQQALDRSMAVFAVMQALRRHAGRLERMFTPHGSVWIQDGKDLTSVKRVLLSGGFHAYGAADPQLLIEELHSIPPLELVPREPVVLVDDSYVLAAVGLAASQYPHTARCMLKRYVLKQAE